MESIGASERVMEFLDKPAAPQLAAGRILPNFSGTVSLCEMYILCQPTKLIAHIGR